MRTPPPSPPFKVGVFVVFYRQLEQGHNIARRGWGKKAIFPPFEVNKTSQLILSPIVASFSNWRTARPIQFDVTYHNSVSGLKVTSFFELADGVSRTVPCNIFYSCS